MARPAAIEESTERAPFRRIAGAAIVAVVLLVEIALAAAWVQLRAERDNLEQADSLSIPFTDTHRRFQQLAFLAVTEPRLGGRAAGLRRRPDHGGPIRLVFPPGNPAGDNANNWIWSMRRATAG